MSILSSFFLGTPLWGERRIGKHSNVEMASSLFRWSLAVTAPVLACKDIDVTHLEQLLNRYGIQLRYVKADEAIEGSWFGEPEAGLVGSTVVVRGDTPVHSALHESCHLICMDPQRRAALHTDAGGGYDEENGVCYLQILLAEHIPEMGRARMMRDMDSWGYTFRLGSTQAWFEQDADDARQWLVQHGLLDPHATITWTLRQTGAD